MPDTLYVWSGRRLVGKFTKSGDRIGFEYASGYSPLSASMALEAKWSHKSPRNFLENLLPETRDGRERMAVLQGAKSASVFDLLDGADTQGGYTYTIAPEPLTSVNTTTYLAKGSEVELVLRSVSPKEVPGAKYSIAGMQPKVTLAHTGSEWLWPDASHPSTHIVKLDASNARNESVYAVATQRLAALCGIDTPHPGILRFGNTEAYVTERFDRYVDNTGCVRRLHTEDFAQMLGRSYRDKYCVSINAILKKLRTLQPYAAEDLQEAFLKQLMFNCCVGNADAHAKNYSILYTPAGIRLAPIYDVVPTVIWGFKELAMKVATVRHSAELSPRIWQLFARRNGLPEEETVSKAVAMSNAVRENFAEAFGSLPKDQLNTAWEAISYANSNMWK